MTDQPVPDRRKAPASISKMMEGSEQRFNTLRKIVENLSATETETAAKVAAAVAVAKLSHQEVVIAADEDGMIVYSNGGLGYTPNELIGKPIGIVVPERFRARCNEGFKRYIQSHHKNLNDWREVPLTALCKDGKEIEVKISFEDVTVYGRRMIVGVIVLPTLSEKELDSVADQVTDKVTEKVMENIVDKLQGNGEGAD